MMLMIDQMSMQTNHYHNERKLSEYMSIIGISLIELIAKWTISLLIISMQTINNRRMSPTSTVIINLRSINVNK